MWPAILARAGRRTVAAEVSRNHVRFWAMWKVATTGSRALRSASRERLGTTGSCRCSRSKSPSASHSRTRRATSGPKETLATAPFEVMGTARPVVVT
jgi:hypothetical protein